MKLIRSLVLPWFLFFTAIVTALILFGVKFTHIYVRPDALQFGLIAGSILCLLANVRSLGNVGIWMSESLPESLRYSSWRWLLRAVKAVAIAAAFYFVGQFSWMPLIWPAFVVPSILTICLFVVVWSLEGPVLKFSSNMAWSKIFSVVLSLPIVALVPLTAQFIGQNVVTAYRASQPDALFATEPPPPAAVDPKAKGKTAKEEKDKKGKIAAVTPPAKTEVLDPNDPAARFKSAKISERGKTLRDIAGQPDCSESDKEIIAGLDPRGPDDVVYWAVKSVSCSSLRSVVGLPRLVDVMTVNPNPTIRAAAITAMKKFGTENVRQIGYLLVKRLSDKEPAEVVEAAAVLMAPLGGNDAHYASNRLKALLDSRNASQVASKVLMRDYGREDLVEEYVQANLTGPEESKVRAIGMICSLSKPKRASAEPHVQEIVGLIKSAEPSDPAVQALNCLGPIGFKAIRDEVNQPKRLERSIAARVLAEMNVKDVPEAIETADGCTRDQNEQVRKWCSRSLGQMGAPALPKILALLQSNDSHLKDAGKNALDFFDDPRAKEELRRVKAENSGWMANNKKLQIAKAVGTALLKIETAQAPPPPVSAGAPAPTSVTR